jgi:hypothetical protein
MLRRLLAPFVLLCLVGGIGCSFVLGYDGYSTNVTDCAHAGLPTRPPNTSSGVTLTGLVAAVTSITLDPSDQSGRPRALGFDLDNACTCPGPGSCHATTGAQQVCDDPGTGRDHALNTMLASFKAYLPQFQESNLNQNLAAGDFGLVVEIDNYNGQANDPAVDISLFNGLGLANDAGAPTGKNDAWVVEGSSSNTPLYRISGYVADGVLAAKFVTIGSVDAFSLRLRVPALSGAGLVTPRITFTEAWLSAKIAVQNGKLTLTSGQLGGRVSFQSGMNLVRAFGCTDELRDTGRQQLCANADLADTPNGACNVLSFAMGFQAVPATIAAYQQPTDLVPCADAGTVNDCTH